MNIASLIFISLILLAGSSCSGYENQASAITNDTLPPIGQEGSQISNDPGIRTIHVFVALCDNKYQGIVPVPAAIGNGQDPKNNLYWGAGYGVRSFFAGKSKEWKLLSVIKNPAANILERLLLKHNSENVYLMADAYDGRYIKEATVDFLTSASGKKEVKADDNGRVIYFGGTSDLIAYTGHDGLMDFSLTQRFEGDSTKKRETIILACYSKRYFQPHLKQTRSIPLLWTSGLMAPEAYTLYDAIHSWINKETDQQIRLAAAKAYSKYQKCGVKAAQNLLLTGY